MQLKCYFCNKIFTRSDSQYQSELKRGQTRFFCSLSCCSKQRQKENPNKRIPVFKRCLFCDNNFVTHSGKHACNYCSKQCATNDKKLFDEHVFDNIGIKEAYFLGLYFADGCICKTTNGRHMIRFNSKDQDLISSIRSFFKSTNAISASINPQNNKTYYSITFSSEYLFNMLHKLGCVQQKSSIVNSPNINSSLYMPFLLGLFDGDGSISCNKSINSWKVSYGTASISLHEWLMKIIDETGISYSKEIRTTKTGLFYMICFCGISAQAWLNCIYGAVGQVVHPLDRKYKLFEYISHCKFRKAPNLFSWEMSLLKTNFSNKEVADLIKCDKRNYGWQRSEASIRLLRKRYKENHINAVK